MKRIPTLFVCAAFLATALCVRESFAATTARVQSAANATLKRSSAKNFIALKGRTSLGNGDVVRTGTNGKANLLFYDGSQARMGANSALEITPPTDAGGGRKSFFRALGGQVWARLRPGTAARTRTAVAGVRGTEILLQVADDDTTTLTVIDGSVDFYNEFGAVVVNASQQSVAAPGRAPTTPITIDNPGLLIEWTFDVDYAVLPREKFWTALAESTPDAALAQRAAAAQANPDDIEAQRTYGDVLFDLRRYEEALAVYQTAAQIAPANRFAIRLGYAFLELGQLDEAETQFRSALETAPANVARLPQNQARLQAIGWALPISQLQTVAAAGSTPGESTPNVAALVGLAWLELARNHAGDAESWARRAVAATPENVEALIALGVSQLRQNGKLEEAVATFEKAKTAHPENGRYQAQAWLALALLARGDNAGALHEAQAAVKAQPASGLARGHLALALLYNGKSYDSAREARRAVELNPDAVAARVALAQTLLARGDTDAAAREAAMAVALDPQLPQGFYILGLADAARRDYSHAARELQNSLRLAPDFLPAAAALARVYNLMGREDDARVLLADFQTRFPDSDEVYAALGQVYYQQGNYRESAVQYRKAAEIQPESALYQAELARVLLDDNQLNAALEAGQRAVYIAPQVGQYHALLGLIADFSNLTAYAEREYRTAIALDPQNALARLRLGVRNADPRVGVNTTAQAFLFDPAVGRQVFRGGVNGELTLSGGSDNALGALFSHRAQNDDGSIYSYGAFGYNRSDGADEAPNDDSRQRVLQENVNWLPDNKTNVLLQGVDVKTRGGLNGPDAVLDDRTDSSARIGAVAVRRRFGNRHYLWVGGNTTTRRNTTLDPNADSDINRIINPFIYLNLRSANTTRSVEPEIRLDLNLNPRPERRSTLTLGAGYAKARSRTNSQLAAVSQNFPIPFEVGEANDVFERRTKIFYIQWAQRVNDKLSFVAQLRRQDALTDASSDLLGVQFPDVRLDQSRILPALLINYQLDRKTALRFFANRRNQDIGFESFVPTEALLSSEIGALPLGITGRSRLYELDIERYFSPRTFGKVFVFHSRAENLAIGPGSAFGSLTLAQARRSGAGVRFEHQLSDNLFANLQAILSDTKSDDDGAFYAGEEAPYQPSKTARFALNYVDPKGNKAAAVLNYTSSFFRDRPINSLPRSRFGGKVTLDLRFAREPSLQNEFFINIYNVFDTKQIVFDQFPAPGRRIEAGWTRRF
jgi:tetratricopeptide (TPR) repeat protein